MAQVFEALPGPPPGLLRRWRCAPAFHWEVASRDQTIHFALVTPRSYHGYLASQITAVYPDIRIIEREPDAWLHLDPTAPTAVCGLGLAGPNPLPLRMFDSPDIRDTDPLSAFLSALSRLREGETALLQLTVARAAEDWKDAAHQPISPDDPRAAHAHLVRDKLSLPGFRFALHLVTQAPTQARLAQLERSLVEALQVFDSPVNRLEGGRPWWGGRRRLRAILERRTAPRRQILSSHELATLFHLPNHRLADIKNIAWGRSLPGEPPAELPLLATAARGERLALNALGQVEVKNKQQVFGLRKLDRRRHLYVVGKTGTGKSTLLANMIVNDLRHGEGLAVVDPHGDLVETVLDFIPKRRINDTVVLDPADPEAVVRLNLFDGGTVVHRELVASGLVAMFYKLYSHSWGPRLEHILRSTLLTLLSRHARLEDVLRLLTDEHYRQRVVDKLDDPVLAAFWRHEFEGMHERQRAEAIAPILNKIGQFVTSPLVRRVANARHSSIDIEDILNEGKILLVNVSQGKLGEDNAALLGAMLITRLQLAAMNRVYLPEGQRRDFFLYIDEFQNFATTSFIKILSEARKYRLNLVLANQYIAQVPPEVREAILGNAGSLVSFTLGAHDAAVLRREFGDLYSEEDLVSLGRYQVICKLTVQGEVTRPFPAHTLPLAKTRTPHKDKVLRVSRERYARK